MAKQKFELIKITVLNTGSVDKRKEVQVFYTMLKILLFENGWVFQSATSDSDGRIESYSRPIPKERRKQNRKKI